MTSAFPGQTLFQDLNFEIKRGERVAIIGNNGTGKTTILKILNEVIRPDAGSFTLGSRVQIGYYDQEHQVLHMEKTIFQEISDAYPYLTNTEIRNVLAAFLFTNDDVFQPIHTLSGGERGRISLAKLMPLCTADHDGCGRKPDFHRMASDAGTGRWYMARHVLPAACGGCTERSYLLPCSACHPRRILQKDGFPRFGMRRVCHDPRRIKRG